MLEEDPISRDLKLFADGPDIIGVSYERYVVNGFRFHTSELEHKRKTQNSGISVKVATSSYSSTRDENPILSELDYYGVLTEIIELRYVNRQVVLFGCDWVSKGKRLKQNINGFTIANFTNIIRHEEPFILSSQATQVFHVGDPVDTDWHVVISTRARGVYNMEPLADVKKPICKAISVVLQFKMTLKKSIGYVKIWKELKLTFFLEDFVIGVFCSSDK
ncbi:uncharacterized protein LOC131013365 [Salvia miltiorrhiza]|uniref:uncharacterized protein LOC131013365 n=1 Tax=Salvia miltiorrhiza TaxID=226208 RepID=UPI0025AD4FE0|nr:uncharacterized protein LOC131013365 [Salvia miltiorrhiza]